MSRGGFLVIVGEEWGGGENRERGGGAKGGGTDKRSGKRWEEVEELGFELALRRRGI